jgi:hypothetical protein
MDSYTKESLVIAVCPIYKYGNYFVKNNLIKRLLPLELETEIQKAF